MSGEPNENKSFEDEMRQAVAHLTAELNQMKTAHLKLLRELEHRNGLWDRLFGDLSKDAQKMRDLIERTMKQIEDDSGDWWKGEDFDSES